MISEGDYVLLYMDERRNWIVRVESSRRFHTHKGAVTLSDLVGKPFGSVILTDLDQILYAIKPTINDHIGKMHRPTQILYEKDIGLALVNLGIGPGSRVVETGTGSGAMTCALANAVKPDGHIFTYEIRPDMAEVAHRNLLRVGLENLVTIKTRDAKLGFCEEDVDAVLLDLAEPWEVVICARHALRPGYRLCSFSPTINQVERTVDVLRKSNFTAVRTVECFLRDIRVETGSTRPRSTMIGHTGYLTFATKVLS